MIPVEAFRRVGLYDEKRLPHYGADWEFARRAQRGEFELLMTYRARVFSGEGATGLLPSTQTLSWSQFVRAYIDVRSPNNLRCRWNFALLCAEPAAFTVFLVVDLVRTIGGGVRRQVLCRVCRVR